MARSLARSLVKHVLAPREPILIVGTGRVARRVAEKLASRPEFGLEVAGFMDDDPLELPEEGPQHLGEQRKLEQIVRAYGIERVVVAFSKASGDAHVELLRRCADLGVRVDIVPRMYEEIGSRSVLHNVAGIPLVEHQAPRLSRSARILKRSMDLVLSGLAIYRSRALVRVRGAAHQIESKGPIFYRQERMGAGGNVSRWKSSADYQDETSASARSST